MNTVQHGQSYLATDGLRHSLQGGLVSTAITISKRFGEAVRSGLLEPSGLWVGVLHRPSPPCRFGVPQVRLIVKARFAFRCAPALTITQPCTGRLTQGGEVKLCDVPFHHCTEPQLFARDASIASSLPLETLL